MSWGRTSLQRSWQAWYVSDEYQAVVGLPHGSATSNLVIVSGYPG